MSLNLVDPPKNVDMKLRCRVAGCNDFHRKPKVGPEDRKVLFCRNHLRVRKLLTKKAYKEMGDKLVELK